MSEDWRHEKCAQCDGIFKSNEGDYYVLPSSAWHFKDFVCKKCSEATKVTKMKVLDGWERGAQDIVNDNKFLNTEDEVFILYLERMLKLITIVHKQDEALEFYDNGDWDPVRFEGCQGEAADCGETAHQCREEVEKILDED